MTKLYALIFLITFIVLFVKLQFRTTGGVEYTGWKRFPIILGLDAVFTTTVWLGIYLSVDLVRFILK